MTVRRVMGIETEYGISVPGHPNANAMLTSSQIVNAYAAAMHRARRAAGTSRRRTRCATREASTSPGRPPTPASSPTRTSAWPM